MCTDESSSLEQRKTVVKIKAVILAAGYATRLREITRDVVPKPLLPVAGRPMIEHILFRVEEIEQVDTIYVVTNERFYQQFVEWQRHYRGPRKVVLVNDGTTTNEDRLGPVGDMQYVVQQEGIDEDLLVIAGDNLFDFSLRHMYHLFQQTGASVVALHDLKDPEKIRKRFGNAVLDKKTNRVTQFLEKPEKPLSSLAATCCYMIQRSDLGGLERCVAEFGKAEAGNFMIWLTKNSQVFGYVFSETCIDVGTPEDYHRANEYVNGAMK